MGPIIVPPGGHSVPSTPPVVTIAPTKTVNGVWRSEGRQQEAGSRGSSSSSSRDRLISDPPLAQEKAGGPTVPSHLLGTPYSFGLPPSSVVQDSRFPPLNLQRPVHHVVPPSAVTEDYLRSFRPYHTAEDLRMSSLPPLGLDPATAAAYYHPSYLTHHPFPHPAFRMDDSYCLSALRSPFYPLPAPGSLPPLHPSAMHLHLSGRRLRQEKEDRQSQVSEFRQQVLEQHLDMGRAPSQPEPEHRSEHSSILPPCTSTLLYPSPKPGPCGFLSVLTGYYYDLDDSCDDSDEEEVRAHLRCVAEQPPLKLDTSSEKLEFLQLFGLTTQQQKEELLSQKRRKRRRMLRERSPSPPTVQNKRRTPSPRLPLSTRYSPDEMNNSPNFEEKKRFLTIFNLTHISAEKRKDKEKLVEMLQAMKQKTTPAAVVVKSSPRDSPSGPATEPPVPPLLLDPDKPMGIAVSLPEAQKTTEPGRLDQLRPQELPRAKELAEKPPRLSDGHPGKKALSILGYVRGPLPKDIPVPLSHSMNGKSKPWEPFIAEEFAHQFHESVLQSTQKALQKHKGGTAALTAEQNHKLDTSIHYNIPELQASSRLAAPPHNGTAEGPLPHRALPPLPRDSASEEEDEEEDEEEEEEEEYPRPKWQGIEAIFEAYQEHIEEQNLERQVLQSQCRRPEAPHYSLSLTAEPLSHSMAAPHDLLVPFARHP
ncbi:PREDICTED: genetic suppressor element 1 [Chaetura pelagica]|uniref:genetic suppressor element 1 n=1 Tax=Chaetura pelagica TaxID=8897 RepID=UPI000523613B|nr:PREDICTED: genetic suppressor element 1 [Chaetura pelagica]